jgi:hypothetical protein
MERVSPWALGGALAITVAVLYAVCAAAFALAPGATLDFFNAWFHGLNLAGLQAGAKPFTLGVFLYGLVGIAVTAFVTGAVFAAFYNLLRRR